MTGVGEKLTEGTLETYEVDRDLTVHFPEAMHTWSSRDGEYLGRVSEVERKLPRLEPLILARLPYRVRGVDLKLPSSVKQGGEVKVEFSLRADARPADHVIRLDVYLPDDTWAYWYSDTPLASAGAGEAIIPLAEDDPTGRWRVVARDTVTGLEVSKTFRVGKG
jgi:hypothetical protein